MSIRMRHTRAHTANRRSHHALVAPRLSKCANCGATHRRHMACVACGQYRGKTVIDTAAKMAKKMKRADIRTAQKTEAAAK